MNEQVASHGVTVRAARAFRFADRATVMLTTFWRSLTRALGPAYRPEQHYMRGPGPKWHARNHATFGAVKSDLRRRNDNRSAGATR